MARYNVDLQDNEGKAYQIMANPDSVAEFSPAANRENIRSGETYRVIFGKIMKYLSEVGNAAYVGLANNCTTTIAGFALDARQGKELMDRINELNRDLGGLSFGQDGDGRWGYKIGGADPVIPFKSSKVAMGGFKFLGNNGNPNGATVDVGFKPDFIMYGFLGGSDITKAFYNGNSGNDRTLVLWWAELQKEFIWDSSSSNPPKCIRRSFPSGASTGNRLALQEVTDTGFKVYGGYGSGAAFYICIKL